MIDMATSASADQARWERRGQQDRSHRTQDAILDAAEVLFGRRGVEATTVTEIAAEAERSIGSLYHHFTNKETLVAAVVDRLLHELEAAVRTAIDPARWDGADITSIARTYLTNSLALSTRRPGYKRILIEVSLTDAPTRDRYRRLRQQLDAGLAHLLLARRTEIGHPDPDLAARFGIDQLTSMLTARLDTEMTPTQLEATPDTVFVDEAVDSLAGYLRTRDGSGQLDTPISYTVDEP